MTICHEKNIHIVCACCLVANNFLVAFQHVNILMIVSMASMTGTTKMLKQACEHSCTREISCALHREKRKAKLWTTSETKNSIWNKEESQRMENPHV